jgi:hypothetical protein
VVAVDIESGDQVLFDTQRERIGPRHIVASGAMLVEFPPVEIGGRLFGDGGLRSNLPIDVVARQAREDMLCFAVDVFSASKFAIRGLSFSLREELFDIPEIQICVISPASIDTPLWPRSANYSGRKVKALDPIYPPDQVAAIMVDLVRSPRREVFAEAVAWMAAEQHAAAPELTESMYAAFTRGSLFREEPAEPSAGVLFDPAKDEHATATGGWLAPDLPGIPASDVFSLGAGPAFLAMAPPLYAWKLSYEFLDQLGRQFLGPLGNGAVSNSGRRPSHSRVARI